MSSSQSSAASPSSVPPQTIADVVKALAQVAPDALLVPPRLLRRIIKQHSGILGFGLSVPHRKTYSIPKADLATLVEPDELGLVTLDSLPANVLLLARPQVQEWSEARPADLAVKVWRLLFHVRMHAAIDAQIAAGGLGEHELQSRLEGLGRTEFAEIEYVLASENFLLPPTSPRGTYCEFLAVFWELRFFAETLLPYYFPALVDLSKVEELLNQDVDARKVLQETRIAGAPDPRQPGVAGLRTKENQEPHIEIPSQHLLSNSQIERLAQDAAEKDKKGNDVRAALQAARAATGARPEAASPLLAKAEHYVGELVSRLQAALGFSENQVSDWQAALASLLPAATQGFWTPGARLLYDLQRLCLDHERGVFKLDLYGWLISSPQAPLKRPLPSQREVLICRRLRTASARLPAVATTRRERQRLGTLLQFAVHRAEARLRDRLRPGMDASLELAGLRPENLPERVARAKVVEELLDRVVERGFIALGDLRDALSRNQLKMADLDSPLQLWSGDPLLLADRRLAKELDGAYRPGEIYLRLLQKLSSVAFGTWFGRLFIRFVAIPFGGAYVLLAFLIHLIELFQKHVVQSLDEAEEVADVVTTPVRHAEHPQLWMILLVGGFILGISQHAGFRAWCGQICRLAGSFLYRGVLAPVVRLAQLRWVQEFLASRYYRWVMQGIIKPIVLPLLLGGLWRVVTRRRIEWSWVFAGWGLLAAFLNTRWGRAADELVTDVASHYWNRLRIHVFVAFYRLVTDVSHQVVESLERLLYSVDEWLRFRTGESRLTTVSKAGLSGIWFTIQYVVRFCLNLLIEPQVNPIKHFPVVTVSHKLLIPTIPHFGNVLESSLGLGSVTAHTYAAMIVFAIPGIFGFLVWELKENWRLYQANRPTDLHPVVVGHHGEAMLHMLRPGFHSGRIPKSFAKLRKSARKAIWSGDWRGVSKQRAALLREEECVRHFFDRELVALLRESGEWPDADLATGEIQLACNRIRVELYSPALGTDGLEIVLDEQKGWLIAGLESPGWFRQLSEKQQTVFLAALAGCYKLAGVSLVREQADRAVPDGWRWEFQPPGLVVQEPNDGQSLPTPAQSPDAEIDLHWHQMGLDPSDVLFARIPLPWEDWVRFWGQTGRSQAPVWTSHLSLGQPPEHG